MFQSYTITSRNVYISTDYRIVDTDFDHKHIIATHDIEFEVEPECAVIQLYEKLNLPVVPNLIRCMMFTATRIRTKLKHVIEYNSHYNPYWKKYGFDVEKYLTLL